MSNSVPPGQHSLPARPPAPATFKPAFSAGPSSSHAAPGVQPGVQPFKSGGGVFSAFQPRSIASTNQTWRTASPSISSGPTPPSNYPGAQQPSGSFQDPYSRQQQAPYYPQSTQEQYGDRAGPPQIHNPFPLPGQNSGGVSFDPEEQAQIAQWSSAYNPSDNAGGKATGANSAGGANAVALGTRTSTQSGHDTTTTAKPNDGGETKKMTVYRSGGGKTWQDTSLLEWDPTHWRLFIGNLAGEVTDESLLKAFSKFDSVQKARVVRDKRTTKSKGYGFVSFSDGDQYFKAAREMQGKYIGSHPIQVQAANTKIDGSQVVDKRGGKKGKGVGSGANTGAGVQKKQHKTKGGLKILG